MYNFHIYVHYMKSSTSCVHVCLFFFSPAYVSLLDLAIVRTSEEEEELLTLSIGEHRRFKDIHSIE
jgi:hypothetical protein